MNIFTIAWRSIRQRSFASLLTVFSMALGVTMVVAVLTIHGVVTESFSSNSTLGYNVIIGAKGGSLQLVLNSVYYLDKPVGNLPYDYYLEFLPAEARQEAYEDSIHRAGVEAQRAALELAQVQHGGGLGGLATLGTTLGDKVLSNNADRVLDYRRNGRFSIFTKFAIPLCLGDYLEKFRLVGTTPEFFEELKVLDPKRKKEIRFAEGRAFERYNEEHGWYEAVLGSTVARELDLQVGSVIKPAHGSPEGHTHAQGFTVVGVMAPTGTPHDRAVFVNMEGFFLMDGHAKPLEQGEVEEGEAGAAEESSVKETPSTQKWPDPLPLEQRQVTALLVRTSNILVTRNLVDGINRPESSRAQAVLPIAVISALMGEIVGPIQGILLVLTTMICVVSGVTILVGIYNSMSDRRRDIAVMRALGAGRLTVSGIILVESIILSVGGGLLGLLLGHTLNAAASGMVEEQTGVKIGFFTLAPGVNVSDLLRYSGSLSWDFAISLEIVVLAGLVLLAVVAGVIPALSAYRTDVSKSLAP